MATHDPSLEPQDPQLPPDWPRDTPFVVPAGYFDDFAARLQLQLEPADAPDPVLPPAWDRRGEGPFQVPAGYFATLPTRIAAAREPARFPRLGWPVWALAAAAGLALLLAIGWWGMRPQPAPGLAEVSTPALLAAIEAEDLPADLIVEAMTPEAIAALRVSPLPEANWEDLLEEVDTEALEAAWLDSFAL